MNPILMLLTAGVLMAAGDIALAAWARGGPAYLAMTGLFLNMIGIASYALTLGTGNIGAATAAMLGLNILFVALAGFFMLGQTASMAQIAGILVLISSIIFIEIAG